MPHISFIISLDSPPKRRSLLIAAFFLSLAACSETTPKGVPKVDSPANVNETQPPSDGQPANTPPAATIAIISPSSGDIPLTVTLSTLESSDAEDSAEQLVARWDFDGDGSWDTVFSTQKIVQHIYIESGTYSPVVQIRDSGGLFSEASLADTIEATSRSGDGNGDGNGDGVSPLADIDGDSNRDGQISNEDDSGEETWSTTTGIVFVSNLDDDDNDGLRDGLDSKLNGGSDLNDMTQLVVRQINGLTDDSRVELSLTPPAATNYIRIFQEDSSENLTLLLQTEQTSATLSNTTLAERDLSLRLEGIIGRFGDFDGNAQVTVTIKNGSTVISEDTVALRGAPIIFPDHTQQGTRFFLMRIPESQYNDSNLAFYEDVQNNLPSNIEFYTVDGPTYGYDRWLQDNMQTGYTQRPSTAGSLTTQIHLETQRSQYPGDQGGLIPFLTNELLAEDLGYVYPQGTGTSLNYGGNLEVAPPHSANGKEYPFGRIVYGGGSEGLLEGYEYTDRMNENQLSFLNAQGIQAPALEVSSEWLAVGHIDEIFLFLKRNTGEGSPWVVAIASPTLARQRLQQALDSGNGDTKVFKDRGEYETTVGDILGNIPLMTFNELAQVRIDSIQEILKNNLGLNDEDFIEVPVLFENFNGSGQAVALNPGVQNLVTANSVLFVPDPEGPIINGQDLWQISTREALEPLGYEVRFVDVFYSYHVLMGEAHCGSNFERAPSPLKWWEEEE